MVDYIVDTAEIPLSTPPLPNIVAEIAALFGLSPVHTGILIALFALEDIEPIGNMMRNATHRTQMKIIADVAEVDLTTFVRETAPGSPLERLGLIAYRGGRDEIADMNVSRPLVTALGRRAHTLAATNRHFENARGPRGSDGENGRCRDESSATRSIRHLTDRRKDTL